jgi:hypothetical protein
MKPTSSYKKILFLSHTITACGVKDETYQQASAYKKILFLRQTITACGVKDET